MKILETISRIGYIKILAVVALLAVVIGLSMIGGNKPTNTESTPVSSAEESSSTSLYISPSSGELKVGTEVEVKLYENSAADSVNVAQMKVTYPVESLKFVRVSEGTAFPIVAATDTATPGVVRIARAIAVGGTPVSGRQVVATLHFTVLSSASSTAALRYETAESLLMRSSDSTNIVKTVSGADFTIKQ